MALMGYRCLLNLFTSLDFNPLHSIRIISFIYLFSSDLPISNIFSLQYPPLHYVLDPLLPYTHTYIKIYTQIKYIHYIYDIICTLYIILHTHIYVYFKHSLIFLTYTFHEDCYFQQHTTGISRPYNHASRGFLYNIHSVCQDHT